MILKALDLDHKMAKMLQVCTSSAICGLGAGTRLTVGTQTARVQADRGARTRLMLNQLNINKKVCAIWSSLANKSDLYISPSCGALGTSQRLDSEEVKRDSNQPY